MSQLFLGQDNDLAPIVRPARGRIYTCAIAYPQSFGANAPPTWGLRQIGPPRGGPYPLTL